MSFHSPQVFYWLIAIFPWVILWHLLKLRRQDHPVASLMLWVDVAEDARANMPFQRLRRPLSLLLQLLILLSALAALAQPIRHGSQSEAVGIILQNSASMQAKWGSHTRWDEAKTEIRRWSDALDSSTRVYLIEAGTSPHLSIHDERIALRERLDALEPQDAPADLPNALRLAHSLGEMPIHLYGDRLPSQLAGQVDFHPIWESQLNHAITEVQLTPEGDLIVGVASFAEEDRSWRLPVGLSMRGQVIEQVTLSLEAGQTRYLRFALPLVRELSVAEVRLGVEDALPVDDVAWVVLHPAEKHVVQVVSETPNPYLMKLLETAPNVEPEFIPTASYVPGAAITILYGTDRLPHPGAWLRIVRPTGRAESATILDGDASHPILSGMDLDFWIGKSVQEVASLEVPPEAHVLLSSDRGPLLWVEVSPSSRSVTVAWDIFGTANPTFTRSYAAWLLIVNALEWLHQPIAPRSPVPAGTPVLLHPRMAEQIVVEKPNGMRQSYLSGPSEVIFDETDLVGVYVLSAEGWSTRFAVNLLNAQESDLNQPPAEQTVTSPKIAAQPQALWRWFVLAAIGAVLAEWWITHRRY